MEKQLLTFNDLVAMGLNVSRVTIWRMVREGRFPPKLDTGGKLSVWRRRDVEAWLEAGGAAQHRRKKAA